MNEVKNWIRDLGELRFCYMKSEDFELDDVYVALIDYPICNGAEAMMSYMSEHVDQYFVVLMSSFATTTTITEIAKEIEESSDFELDDVYIALVDDPMSSSGDEFDHEDQRSC